MSFDQLTARQVGHQTRFSSLELPCDAVRKAGRIDLGYMQPFAHFLDKLDRTKDADGNSVLHNSMIVYGCGNADGNRHNHDNLAVILAGAGGRTLRTGRWVQMASKPMTHLFLGMTDRMGVTGLDRISDSSGRSGSI